VIQIAGAAPIAVAKSMVLDSSGAASFDLLNAGNVEARVAIDPPHGTYSFETTV
jgi:hypothetical protein